MTVFLWTLYLLVAATRIAWWIIFRVGITKKTTSSSRYDSSSPLGMSIVVCSHNNAEGLKKLIPLLLSQEYPEFEPIIVNDRSTDSTNIFLKEQDLLHSKLTVISIQETPSDWNPKKFALQQGLLKAQYPLIALTDSDCIPMSNQWLRLLSEKFKDPKVQICLGYSPYQHQSGILNKIIRTETLFTACQYLSLAQIGKAYMGVGRNLAYRKSFVENHLHSFPFHNHLGGDDDLFINQLSAGNDAIVALESESFILTFPPKTLENWWKQKRRHLSAGAKYKTSTRWILGSYWISASLFWLLFILLASSNLNNGMIFMVHLCVFGLGIIILNPIFRIFKEGTLFGLFPFWDFLYIASSSIIGFSTFFVKNKRWS